MSERAGDVTQINKNHLLKKRSVFSTAVHKKRLVVSGSFLCKWHCVRCSVVGWPLNWFISPWATVAWVLFIGSPVDNVFFPRPEWNGPKARKNAAQQFAWLKRIFIWNGSTFWVIVIVWVLFFSLSLFTPSVKTGIRSVWNWDTSQVDPHRFCVRQWLKLKRNAVLSFKSIKIERTA